MTVPASGAAALSSWRPGDPLGPYTLDRWLGAGSFGEVWEASDRSMPDAPRKVALKVLSIAGIPGAREALLREANVCRDLNHPHIVEVLGVHDGGDAPFLVMEYVDGLTLEAVRNRLRRAGVGFPRGPLLDTFVGVADALDHAWTAPGRNGQPLRLLHRNLRPADVMIGRGGEVKVGGFNLARVAEDRGMGPSTVVRSSPTYMAPERWTGLAPMSPATDLWALGVMLWEMAEGRRFYPKVPIGRMFALIEERTPAEEGSALDDSFPELRPIVERLLQRPPADRPQHPGEVRDALRALRKSVGREGDLEQLVWMLDQIPDGPGEEDAAGPDADPSSWDALVSTAERARTAPKSLPPVDTGAYWTEGDWTVDDWAGWDQATADLRRKARPLTSAKAIAKRKGRDLRPLWIGLGAAAITAVVLVLSR
jgi:serine/threonine-protein kinase